MSKSELLEENKTLRELIQEYEAKLKAIEEYIKYYEEVTNR